MADRQIIIDHEDKDVQDSLKVISDYNDQRIEQDRMIDAIQELYEEPFIINAPKGTQKLSGLLLFQAIWRTCSWMKPLDFMLHGSGASPQLEKVQRDGLNTVLDRGGFISCLRGKMGAFFNLLLYGDDLIMAGIPDDDCPFPIEFSNISLKNCYTNRSALGIRVHQKGRSARQFVFILNFTKGEFDEKWPKFKDKVSYSDIPRAKQAKDQLESIIQNSKREDKEIEVAFSFNLDTKCFLVTAGGSCTKLEKKKGKEYPFIFEDLNGRKKPYIPIFQFSGIPSSEGFWNRGLGHLLYKLTIITRKMMNMEVTHILDNILPIELISLASGKTKSFFKNWTEAEKMREMGKRGVVPMERSPDDPNSAAVSSQTLVTQNLFSEWQAVYQALIQEVQRLGINLDEIEAGGNKTATEIIYLEESSKAFIRQLGEWNGSENQMAIEITINHIKEFIKKNDKTPLDLTTKIQTTNGEQRMDDITLGMIAEEFKKRRWFPRMDLRSGAILSNAMLYTRYSAAANFFPQGTPQYNSIARGAAQFFEIDLPEDQPQMDEAKGGKTAEAQGVPATATDRQEINPNVAVRGPAI